MPSSVRPGDEPHHVAETEVDDRLGDRAVRVGLADDDQLDVAAGAQLVDRLEQHLDALDRAVRARHRDDPARHPRGRRRSEGQRVDADRHDPHDLRAHPEVAGDVGRGVGRHRHDRRQPAGHPALHPGEAIPPALAEPLPQVGSVLDLDHPVDAHRVVDRRDQRQAELVELEHAGPEGLVVVHDVELAGRALSSRAARQREGQRLGEPAGPDRQASTTSIQSRYSRGCGNRNGSGSR